jgi:hypothetical protein
VETKNNSKKVVYLTYKEFKEWDTELFKKGRNGKLYFLNDDLKWTLISAPNALNSGDDLREITLPKYIKKLRGEINNYYDDSNLVIGYLSEIIKEEFYKDVLK